MNARRHAPLSHRSRTEFALHAAGYILFSAGFVALSLGIGIIGYHVSGGLCWIDSLLNAAMILTGMGPVDTMQGNGAKIFASLYALFSGAVYPVVTALVVYPFLHRMLAALHLQAIESAKSGDGE